MHIMSEWYIWGWTVARLLGLTIEALLWTYTGVPKRPCPAPPQHARHARCNEGRSA